MGGNGLPCLRGLILRGGRGFNVILVDMIDSIRLRIQIVFSSVVMRENSVLDSKT
jgi:hypothetical protein